MTLQQPSKFLKTKFSKSIQEHLTIDKERNYETINNIEHMYKGARTKNEETYEKAKYRLYGRT